MKRISDRAPTVVVVQTTIPDYRHRFFSSLDQALGSRLTLVSGNEDFAPDVTHEVSIPHALVQNRFLVRRNLLWQSGVVRRTMNADVVVLTLNPRILSNWGVLLVRRVCRKRTFVWGHAWPRTGRASRSDQVRRLMRNLASGVLVYTETDARELREAEPRLHVTAAPNALYNERELVSANSDLAAPTDFVCVGRLNPEKKPTLLLDAFLAAQARLPDDIRLVFVGSGPSLAGLSERVRSANLESRVVFTGHVSDVQQLREIYASAIASVSPGSAGLSLIQSLGFGVPMVIARDEPHGPEIEAARHGENALFVPSGSPRALSEALVRLAQERKAWRAKCAEIAEATRTRYSVERMVDSFLSGLTARDASLQLAPGSLPPEMRPR